MADFMMFPEDNSSTTPPIAAKMTAPDEPVFAVPPDLVERRRAWRRDLLARRAAMPPPDREAADLRLGALLAERLANVSGVLGFYWPIQSEFDARPAVTAWLAGAPGRRAVLPVVVKRSAPLHFREWTPDTPMKAAGFGTSVPDSGDWLDPDALVVPVVGFDAAGYRLGYGGGYYDRTLAALPRRPRTLGVGYEFARLPSIEPQSFDLKLDEILVG
jgi:5-formyltetrahydrofolate cyclo-ligase